MTTETQKPNITFSQALLEDFNATIAEWADSFDEKPYTHSADAPSKQPEPSIPMPKDAPPDLSL